MTKLPPKRKKGQRGKGLRNGDQKIHGEQILDAAIALFAVQGFMTTSMQNIADRLKVSQSAVMYYFPNRLKLFEGCIGLIQGRNRAIVEHEMRPEDDALTRLRKHFHANLRWAVEAPAEAQIILLLYCMASYDPNFAAINGRVLEAARAKVLAFLLAGQREGLFRKDLDAPLAAELLHDNLLAGILTWLTTRKTLKDKGRHVEALKRKWDELIGLVTGGPVQSKAEKG